MVTLPPATDYVLLCHELSKEQDLPGCDKERELESQQFHPFSSPGSFDCVGANNSIRL